MIHAIHASVVGDCLAVVAKTTAAKIVVAMRRKLLAIVVKKLAAFAVSDFSDGGDVVPQVVVVAVIEFF